MAKMGSVVSKRGSDAAQKRGSAEKPQGEK